ncbi:LysR family transcriptional regulator [Serratia fonticola]|uniref:LysR family transcriptional regulator n=1 Tax=Serratia fonticola TaxID=47917 RepID=UPI00192CAC27|nr:LysR family transcriptional regulator [Serratia fonticola]MBL5825866.1 LysR family transcriptional regulator [Serratia fonticola]MBL5861480.1 LysR family transcriptional regulator [Serratia fonticola]
MRNLPKIQQIQLLNSVIKYGSIRAAAKELGLSQPGITRSLQELEQTLGTPLVRRGCGGTIPTQAGIMLNTRIELVLNELKRAMDEIEHLNNSTSGTVSIGISALPISTIFPNVLMKFMGESKKSKIFNMEGHANVLLPLLRSGKLDFIISSSMPPEYLQGLVQESLFKTPYRIYACKGHRLARCTSLGQLQDADWYLPVTAMEECNQLELLLFNSQDRVMMRGSETAALQMALHANCLTVAAKAMICTPFLAQNLCIIQVKEMLPDAKFSLIYSSERPLTQAAMNLMDAFRCESQNYEWD